MGVSILVEWPGSTEGQKRDHPGFRNDDHMWANWVVNVIGEPELVRALEGLGAAVLLKHDTTDLPPSKVGWAKPEEFETAAATLRSLVVAQDPRTKPLVATYRIEWAQAMGVESGENPEDWFAHDLEDVAAIARYAKMEGAEKMTLGYYR